MNYNRLKLYNDSLELVIDHKTKKVLKNIAFKNKLTMSEYVRRLIEIDILKHQQNKINNNLIHTNELITKNKLRGILND